MTWFAFCGGGSRGFAGAIIREGVEGGDGGACHGQVSTVSWVDARWGGPTSAGARGHGTNRCPPASDGAGDSPNFQHVHGVRADGPRNGSKGPHASLAQALVDVDARGLTVPHRRTLAGLPRDSRRCTAGRFRARGGEGGFAGAAAARNSRPSNGDRRPANQSAGGPDKERDAG